MSNQDTDTSSSGPTFSVDDIYYALFRHKWKILICATLGIGAAAAFYLKSPQLHASNASLLIRYVQEGKGPTAPTELDQYKSPDSKGGSAILSAEVEIITSLDVAQAVVDIVGPEKILARLGGGNDRARASGVVHQGLTVNKTKNSSVLSLIFENEDPTIVQPVLNAVIEAYFKRHIEIHRPAGSYDDFLTQQTDQMRSRLATTEEELRKARAKAGIISLEDTRRAQSETINSLKRQLLDVQRTLAQKNATVAQTLHGLKSGLQAPANPTETAPPAPPSAQATEAYQNVVTRLAALKKREQDLLVQFTPENPRVRVIRENVEAAEAEKLRIERENPIFTMNAPQIPGERSTNGEAQNNLASLYAQIAGLESDVKVYGEQLAQVRQEAADLDTLETNIQELERRKSIEETNYKTFAANLERIRMEEALGSGLVTNISRVENPTPPYRSVSRARQIAGGIAGGGLALGLALAFAIEFLFDRTVRRASQVERSLGMDVFVTIPALDPSEAQLNQISSQALTVQSDSVPPWEPANALHAYYSALRDRTISFFDSNDINHKPRLVALTGLGKDHGAKEIAAGLAGCLSETGEGKVLFIDMTSNQGDAQQFFQGHDVSSIDEALTESPEAKGRVNENLYVAGSEGAQGEKLPLILPKRFSHLVPKLRSSDFDYIIFNLPPVSNLSVTPRLAQHMDVVMLVMESEKTDMAAAQKAKGMLSTSKAHVAAILNKTHQYVPRLLSKDVA